jgi:hypothetical protein
VPANLSRNHPEQTPRIDILGIHLQDLAVKLLCLLELACLVVPYSEIKRLGQGGQGLFPFL